MCEDKGHGVCFFCGFGFEDCDIPRLVKSRYGDSWEYEGRKETRPTYWKGRPYRTETVTDHSRDRVGVAFLAGLTVCRGCRDVERDTANKIPGFSCVHPGIKAMDAARERRLRQMDEAIPKPYRDKHPGWTKWDAAVKAGRIALGIVCRYRLVPGASKLGKGVKGIAVESATMDETELADFRARLAAIDAAQKERKRLRIEAAKASQEAAMASCRTIGESAAAVESQVQAA